MNERTSERAKADVTRREKRVLSELAITSTCIIEFDIVSRFLFCGGGVGVGG